tara:strand:- start:253 stop:1323 length:1071 start_codon:yes stop_codon:yes gene_type:complete
MSEIKVNSIKGVGASAAAITVNNTDGTCTANITNNLSNRNKVINGEFKFWQRGTSHTGIAIDQYTADRWKSVSFTGNESGRMTVSQSTDTPDGFQYSMKLDCTTADGSPASGDAICMAQRIEANNIYDVGFGTSGAKKITVSLYAKAVNRTGKYSVSLMNQGSSATNVNCQEIDVTTNWQRFTLNFIADSSLVTTTTGTNSGCQLLIGLYSGTKSISSFNAWNTYNTGNIFSTNQVNFFDNTSNELYITGVQLEVDHTGSGVATDFEHRSFGQELALCERYYQKSFEYHHLNAQNGESDRWIRFRTEMRASPSVTTSPTNSVSFGVHVPTVNGFSGDGSGSSHANWNLGWTASSEL